MFRLRLFFASSMLLTTTRTLLPFRGICGLPLFRSSFPPRSSSRPNTNTATIRASISNGLDLNNNNNPINNSASSSFIVSQYNVLAGSLGSNTHPWFLHGLPYSLTDERRATITSKFYRRDTNTGKLLKLGWPDHVNGILTDEEKQIVEDVDRKYFAWEERKFRLLRTIEQLNADLISLVECDHYRDFWKMEMQQMGYEGIYKRRPGRGCFDGCAIFYRRDVFDLEASTSVELGSGGRAIMRDGGGVGSAGKKSIDRDDDRPISRIGETADRVALFALVRHVPTNRRLIFVSTHLARNPEDPKKTKVRARQIAQILYHVTLFAEEHNCMGRQGEEEEVPVVLAGDLNEANMHHLGTLARIKCGMAHMPCHPFMFTSRAASSPLPTSITACRSMRIDYILLQPSLLKVGESILFEMGQDDEGEECYIKAPMEDLIPNEQLPSDHIPIAFSVSFRDRHSAAEGCAESWAETVSKRETSSSSSSSADSPRPGRVLRLEELETAFNVFDGNGDGVCTKVEFLSGLERLRIGGAETEAVLDALSDLHNHDAWSYLTLDEFRALYVKSWLRQQRNFLDRVRSVRTMFDLSVESGKFSSRAAVEVGTAAAAAAAVQGLGSYAEEKSGDLYTEMDVDGDGIVTLEDVIDHLGRVERPEDSLRNRVVDAFSFFDFYSGNDFSMQELHQCFADACPFEVSTELLQVAFEDIGIPYDERIELDVFIDWLIRIYFPIGWISLVGPIPK